MNLVLVNGLETLRLPLIKSLLNDSVVVDLIELGNDIWWSWCWWSSFIGIIGFWVNLLAAANTTVVVAVLLKAFKRLKDIFDFNL